MMKGKLSSVLKSLSPFTVYTEWNLSLVPLVSDFVFLSQHPPHALVCLYVPVAVLGIRYYRAVNRTDENCAPEELTV